MMNSLAVVLDASEFDWQTEIPCERLDTYVSLEIISKNLFVARIFKSISSMQVC